MIQAAEGDIEVAQRGILYIDEIDKIQRSGSGFKDMRLGVEHALLKILEGSVATVPPQGGFKHPAQPGIPFDTTNVLFICGGAFVGLEAIPSNGKWARWADLFWLRLLSRRFEPWRGVSLLLDYQVAMSEETVWQGLAAILPIFHWTVLGVVAGPENQVVSLGDHDQFLVSFH